MLTISIGENKSAKYGLSVLNELKNRGVKDILIICADGLTGIREAIEAAFPKTKYQSHIVHQVRNTLNYVSDNDRKAFGGADDFLDWLSCQPGTSSVLHRTHIS